MVMVVKTRLLKTLSLSMGIMQVKYASYQENAGAGTAVWRIPGLNGFGESNN